MKHTPSNFNFVLIVLAGILLAVCIGLIVMNESLIVEVVTDEPDVIVIDEQGNEISEYNGNLEQIANLERLDENV